ncbi:DEAD-box ATP-dependent RNA helicase 52C-like isoform X2 [Lycium ferocissimum]|uniref:DEAD-box ATP-dependent RNA helicase 52C-like isoform X2 n=1 Tax=Lycium ferocissimum TaxID=112874 RepID=UPI002814F7E6|nr:DEAD-box ATP-dependent RNA helicase 52C-like isoform X2 [Lycium ferocissimum]
MSTRSTRPTYLPPHLRVQNPRSKDINPYNVLEKFEKLEIMEDAYDDVPVDVSGTGNVPKPVSSFSEMCFSKELNDNIKRCKYLNPTPIQRYAIPVAMGGRDIMACAQTGSGKTAAFCFPIISGILKEKTKRGCCQRQFGVALPLALILSPTRELASQIHEEAKKFSYLTGLKVVVVYGGAPIIPQLRNLEKGVDILVATPGRLVDMIEKSRVSLQAVKYLVLDEADRMLDMGFEPQVRKIVQKMKMPPPGRRQTMLFSATFPTEIQRLASDFLSNYIFLAAGKVGSSTNLIVQRVEFVPDMDKKDHLIDLLHAQYPNQTDAKLPLTLIFVETKRGADALERWLVKSGFPSIAIHGDKVQFERERALKSFKSGHTPVLVATDVAARGLDVPNVAHVINFDLPRNIDDYVHRIGRTGRAGKSGLATAFFSDKNVPLAKDLVELMQGANQEIPDWLSEYAESSDGARTSSMFGGYDYRGTSFHSGSDNNTSQFVDTEDATHYASAFTYGAPFAAGCYGTSQVDSFPAAPYSYSFDYGPVTASGWD